MLDGVRTGSIDARLHSVGAVGAGQFVPVTFGEEMQAFMVFYCSDSIVGNLLLLATGRRLIFGPVVPSIKDPFGRLIVPNEDS